MMYAPGCAIVVFSILLVLAATEKSGRKKGSLYFVRHGTEPYSDQDIEQHISKNERVAPRVQHDEDPLLPTLIQNMIDRFYHQRETGHAQFGFLVLGNPGEGILTMNAIPNDGHGNPIVDNTQPLSPAMFCARLFICALWSPAGKGLTSWLSFVVSSVSLSLSHWYPGSGVVLDCIDS